MINSVFTKQNKDVFLNCGRKFGKTEVIAYILWRAAMSKPNSVIYYIAPQQNQARELIWAPRRLQEFGPPEWVSKVLDHDMRIVFTNGSFIKLDGSDNYEKYRGVNPDFTVYEEFKDHDPRFHDAYDPNRASHNSPLVVIGTPPPSEAEELKGESHLYYKLMHEFANNPIGEVFNFPTWVNSHISKEWLRAKKEALYASGQGDIWEREYEAKRVRGGSGKLLPMFEYTKHVRLHDWEKDKHSFRYYVVADPGSTSVFAMYFFLLNPKTKEVFVIDEIYASDPNETTVAAIYPKMMGKLAQVNPDTNDWEYYYDDAAVWFANELGAITNLFSFAPVRKSKIGRRSTDEIPGLSALKNWLSSSKLIISPVCTSMIREITNYRKDERGRLPVTDDHAIDCLRYFFHVAGLSSEDIKEEIDPNKPTDYRELSVYEGKHDVDFVDKVLDNILEGG